MRVNVDGRAVFIGTGSGKPVATAPTVTFVHGAGMDHTVWVMPARYFARHGYRVLAVDLPGHGRSEGAPLTSIESMAQWLGDVLDVLGVDSTAIVGHSMGSLVAQAFAAAQPARARVVVLMGTAVPMPVTERLLSAAQSDIDAAIGMANGWSHSPRGRLGANANPGFWMLGGGARLIARAAPGVFFADLAACNAFRPGPLTISSPALLILGDADQMTSARAGREVAATIADARVVVLPGCGHAMLSERPNEVLDALISVV